MKIKGSFQIVNKGGDDVLKRLRALNVDLEAVAGWPETSIKPDKGASPAQYMRWNNDGVKSKQDPSKWRIPPRPFMDHAWEDNKAALIAKADRGAHRIMDGKATQARVMTEIALEMKNNITRSVYTGNWTPNAESTKLKKGSSRPLIDLMFAMQTLGFDVRSKRAGGK